MILVFSRCWELRNSSTYHRTGHIKYSGKTRVTLKRRIKLHEGFVGKKLCKSLNSSNLKIINIKLF